MDFYIQWFGHFWGCSSAMNSFCRTHSTWETGRRRVQTAMHGTRYPCFMENKTWMEVFHASATHSTFINAR